MKKILILLLILGCAIAVGASTYYARSMRAQALEAVNARARADSAHAVRLASLDSTINAQQRLIIQERIEKDSIDKELRERPIVRLPGEIIIDTLWLPPDTVVAEPGEEDHQEYRFEGLDGVFGYQGIAHIWPFEYRGIFSVNVFQREPVPIGVRIGCVDDGPVRSASVLFTASEPFNLIPGEVRQDPNLCNPVPSSIRLFEITTGKTVWGGVGLLLGFALGKALY